MLGATSGLGGGATEGPFLVKKGGVWAVFGGFSAPGGSSGCRTSSTSHGKSPKSRQM